MRLCERVFRKSRSLQPLDNHANGMLAANAIRARVVDGASEIDIVVYVLWSEPCIGLRDIFRHLCHRTDGARVPCWAQRVVPLLQIGIDVLGGFQETAGFFLVLGGIGLPSEAVGTNADVGEFNAEEREAIAWFFFLVFALPAYGKGGDWPAALDVACNLVGIRTGPKVWDLGGRGLAYHQCAYCPENGVGNGVFELLAASQHGQPNSGIYVMRPTSYLIIC